MAQPPSREVLGARAGSTLRVLAVYARTGNKRPGRKAHSTVLVTDVYDADTGAYLTDHLWFNQGRVWRSAHLVPGDIVTFTARVIEYRTGYWGANRVRKYLEPPRSDFRLTPPAELLVVFRTRAHRKEAA
jgi:hypothetical protein